MLADFRAEEVHHNIAGINQHPVACFLTLGSPANITVLSKEILTAPDQDLLEAETVMTVVAGKVVIDLRQSMVR
jgi:hypothetical protein